MAYTIDEIFANPPPTAPDEFDEVLTTVVMTQEDGRTSYGAGWLAVDYATKVLAAGIANADPAFNFYMAFSDRLRFSGPSDSFGIQITVLGPLKIRATYTLKSWGNVQNATDLALPANYATVGKIYQGWGETMGHGAGRALNCVSFGAIHRSRVVIL